MADLSPFLFVQIEKIFDFFFLKIQMCPEGAAQIFNFVQIYLLPPFHACNQVFKYSNSKWPTYNLFLFAQNDKIFKILSLGMNISYNNENVFAILYTCINYNPSMNHLRFVMIKFKMADLSLFLFAEIDKIFENFVRPNEYLLHQ